MSFSTVTIEGKRATPDRVYYNGTVINNALTSTQQVDDPIIKFQDQRQTALIADSSSYEVQVQNFSIDGCTLPLFIPQIGATSSSDVTTTIYSVTFGVFDGTNKLSATEYVVWIPENQAPYTIVPTTALPIQNESDYYYSYTYTHFVSLVNTALRTAWATCGGGTTIGTQCPFFEYDESSGLFSLNQDSNTCMVPYGTALPQPYNVTSATTSASGGTYVADEYSFVGMNTCLELLLTNFPSTYYSAGTPWVGTSPSVLLPECMIDMGLPQSLFTTSGSSEITPVGKSLRTQPRTSIFQLVNPFTGAAIANSFYARLPQDYISTGTTWSPIASIVLATTQIPVRNEACANPVVFGTSNLGPISASGAFQKVLVEAPIADLTADIWRGSILYQPFIESYSSLDPSHDGISDIDISLFWRNRLTNSLVPVHISNQGSMSFRLLFKRKTAI
jgi:hypothetical protein